MQGAFLPNEQWFRERGYTLARAAYMLGVTPGRLRQEIDGRKSSDALRHKIEALLPREPMQDSFEVEGAVKLGSYAYIIEWIQSCAADLSEKYRTYVYTKSGIDDGEDSPVDCILANARSLARMLGVMLDVLENAGIATDEARCLQMRLAEELLKLKKQVGDAP